MSLENNNNNDDVNKKNKKFLNRIMDKQGFYIVLLICIVIVAATALWFDNQEGDYFIGEGPTNPFEEDEEPEVILVEDHGKNIDEVKETGKIGEGKPGEDGEIPSEDSGEKSEEKAKEDRAGLEKDNNTEKLKESLTKKDIRIETTGKISDLENTGEVSVMGNMEMPVAGKLALPFADDCLVYHKTLDQWSTHKGIDIQADEGTPVRAALDGEVVGVINDTIMGISIVIKHDNELLTIYSNLSTDAMVKVGEKVKKRQTISVVGKTASAKILESPLLHFQVLKDDKFVDPELYLGKISRL